MAPSAYDGGGPKGGMNQTVIHEMGGDAHQDI